MSAKEFQDSENEEFSTTKLNNGDVRVSNGNSTGAKNGSRSVESFKICHPETFIERTELKNFSSSGSNFCNLEILKQVQNDMKRKCAFTLAETLITLVIIGVVAAITIPNMVVNHRKQTVATKVEKFYSTINQALRLSYASYGSVYDYITPNKTYSYEENLAFLKTYILPYMRYDKIEKSCGIADYNKANQPCVYLPDGSVFAFYVDSGGGDIVYVINFSDRTKLPRVKNFFVFQFYKINQITGQTKVNTKNSVEPYINGWDGKYETLKTHGTWGCHRRAEYPAFCTKLIQMNGWKIPDDYPW